MDELKMWISACADRMDEIVATADAEKRSLTPDEEAEFDRLDRSIEEGRKLVEKHAKVSGLKAELNKAEPRTFAFPAIHVKPEKDDLEFRDLGEFLYCLRFEPHGRKMAEYREQTFGVGTEGGIMVPPQFKPQLLAVSPMDALFRPRATVIPAGDPPDAEITFPMLDQSTNLYGGIQMYKVAEGVSTTESTAAFKDISLKPQGIGGHVVITNKLLRNWQAAGPVITRLMQGAKNYYEDTQFLSGNGVAGPTGIIGHSAAVTVTRETAGSITYGDVVSMYSRTLMRGGSYAWVTSQTTIPSLANIRDAGNNNLWIQSAVAGIPPTLMGIPVLFHERVPALGSAGDLMLVNFSYYLVKDGSGPYVRISDQVYFLQDKTVFQLIWYVDGKPWLDAPVALEGSTSNTVSPFVILA